MKQQCQQVRGLVPEWACSPFVALAVQAHEWELTEIQVFDAKIGSLLDTRSGVVQEEDEGSIP